ncbi:MAG: redoxin domain-containing protein [Bacteroidia bacterium]|nr:redoxin domain-containing protein [Bacteroidia bacterium]
MKVGKLLIIVAFFGICVSSLYGQGYKIKIKVRGLSENDTLLLAHRFAENLYPDDTVLVDKNGCGTFYKKEKLDGGIYVIVIPSLKKRYFEFLMDKSTQFSIETDTTDFIANIKSTGSDENKIFFDWQRSMAGLEKKMKVASEKIKEFSDKKMQDSLKVWQEKGTAIDNDRKAFWEKIKKDNPASLLAKVLNVLTPVDIPKPNFPENAKKDSLVRLFQYVYNKDHYWDNVDFSDERLLRTPFIESKMKDFFKNIVLTVPDSLTKESIKVCELARKNKFFFQYAVVYTTNYFETSQIMGMDRVFVNLAEKYYLAKQCWWADSTLLVKMGEKVAKTKPNMLGELAPDLKMEGPDSKMHQLRFVKADYTILIFWEPSCGHCKKEVPKLYEYYKTVRDKGVEVFAVYTQNEEGEWKKFIEEHGLDWINVYDKYHFTNFRNLYDIYSTPVVYILDKNKKIIAKRIGVEQIEKFLEFQKKNNL